MTRVDRRALFASGAAAALLAAAGVSLNAAPKCGGHLKIAVPRVPSGLAPEASSALFETLTELTPDGLLKPRLATDWETSADARIWQLTLRQSVRFHDGQLMQAKDVAMSLERAPLGLPELAGVDIVNTNTLRVELKGSDPHLPIRLTSADCIVRPASDTQGDGIIGTGCYAARHVTPGGGLVAVRVNGHYGEAQFGWADRVDVVAMSNAGMRAQAFNDGVVDAVVTPDANTIPPAQGQVALSDMVLRSTVGLPVATTKSDPRMAERFWLV